MFAFPMCLFFILLLLFVFVFLFSVGEFAYLSTKYAYSFKTQCRPKIFPTKSTLYERQYTCLYFICLNFAFSALLNSSIGFFSTFLFSSVFFCFFFLIHSSVILGVCPRLYYNLRFVSVFTLRFVYFFDAGGFMLRVICDLVLVWTILITTVWLNQNNEAFIYVICCSFTS